MDALTATEVKILNNLSKVRDPAVLLGTKIQDIISRLPKIGTPVNAVNATMNLAFTGVVIDGETVTIGGDVYEFLADVAQTKTLATNIGVDITEHSMRSTQLITMDTQPTSGDTVTIGEKVYTFVPVGTANHDGEVSIGADVGEAQINLVAAVNGTDGFNTPHPLARMGDFNTETDTNVVSALIGGTAGNAIATTETFTAVTNIFGGATLGGGGDCTAANAVAHLVAAITASGSELVGAAAGAGNSIDLTADVAGAAGNAISLAKTTANGAFTGGATHLAGGVDGTVGLPEQYLIDADYLYVCINPNTVSGKNWRRIDIGDAF